MQRGSLLKLPDNVSSRDGALVEPLSVGLHAVKRPASDRARGVMMGAGPIGLAALTWAKGKGANGRGVGTAGAGPNSRASSAPTVVNPNNRPWSTRCAS